MAKPIVGRLAMGLGVVVSANSHLHHIEILPKNIGHPFAVGLVFAGRHPVVAVLGKKRQPRIPLLFIQNFSLAMEKPFHRQLGLDTDLRNLERIGGGKFFRGFPHDQAPSPVI